MTTVKHVYLCSLAVLGASFLTAQGQSFSDNFSTAGDLLNNYNIYQNTGGGLTNAATGSPYGQSLTGGIGGGGHVTIATPATGITPDSTAIYQNTSFNFSTVGATLNISAYVDITDPTETGNRLLHLGFVNSDTSGLNGNANLSFMSFRMIPTAIGSTTFSLQWQTKTAAGSTVNTAGGANVALTLGDWTQLSLTFQNLGSGNIQGSGFIEDFGANGLTPGATTIIAPITLTSADIASDATVFAAFRSFAADGSGGVANFSASVVPEPGTVVLGGLGLGALLLARHRGLKS